MPAGRSSAAHAVVWLQPRHQQREFSPKICVRFRACLRACLQPPSSGPGFLINPGEVEASSLQRGAFYPVKDLLGLAAKCWGRRLAPCVVLGEIRAATLAAVPSRSSRCQEAAATHGTSPRFRSTYPRGRKAAGPASPHPPIPEAFHKFPRGSGGVPVPSRRHPSSSGQQHHLRGAGDGAAAHLGASPVAPCHPPSCGLLGLLPGESWKMSEQKLVDKNWRCFHSGTAL